MPHFRHYQVLSTSACGAGIVHLGIDRMLAELTHMALPVSIHDLGGDFGSRDPVLASRAARVDDDLVEIMRWRSLSDERLSALKESITDAHSIGRDAEIKNIIR